MSGRTPKSYRWDRRRLCARNVSNSDWVCRNCAVVSLGLPSVITDICGSMNTNIRIVAMPFTTADRVLEVTRSAGFKYPAYSDAKTPVVQRAIAATLSAMTHGDMPSVRRICLMLAAAGFAMRNKRELPPRAGSEGQESERLSQN